ncbi:hypothetical protein [Sporosarcina sp. FSL W7-1283]|uniref:hypothetical protein n=1 Tax=Sporosarcina sp. FSL W7-1283 TaxID=2921560 RepID=UPI0030F72302
MRDVEITKREILVSIIIILIMMGLGFFLSTSIHNKVSVSNEKYFKALKIDNLPELFNYAINTEVGHVLSYGKFKANEPVSDTMIKGKYFSIKRIEEHYVMKTRVVTYTDSNGKSQTKTETYWEWDEWKRDYFHTKTFNYLGRDFKIGKVKIDNYIYGDTVKKSTFSNIRWVFYVIPKEFEAALYSNTSEGTINQNELYENQTIERVIERKESGADRAVILFWIGWAVLIVGAVVIFVMLDNKFINNK